MEQTATPPQVDEVILEEGDIICNKCEGSGYVSGCDKCEGAVHVSDYQLCPKCQGEKKLDWISAITGVASKLSTSCGSHGSSSSSGSTKPSIPFYTWGRNDYGQLGVDDIRPSKTVLKKIRKGVVKIE